MNRDRVLVVGAAGIVGRHVREAFASNDVVATYHRTPAHDALPLDATDAPAMRALVRRVRPRTIVLAAAEAYVERCEREPEATRQINVDAARAFVDIASEIEATLVVFSSEYVFDGTAGAYGEDDATAPLNEYGRQKVDLERIARSMQHHLVCRTSAVYGWEASGKNFVCQLVRRLRASAPFEVPADQLVTPTFAPELGRAVASLVRAGLAGTYHVVGPAVLPRPEFARLAARAFGLPVDLIRERPTAELGLVAPRPLRAGLRDDKLRAALGRPLLDPGAALELMRRTEKEAAGPGEAPTGGTLPPGRPSFEPEG